MSAAVNRTAVRRPTASDRRLGTPLTLAVLVAMSPLLPSLHGGQEIDRLQEVGLPLGVAADEDTGAGAQR